MSDYLDAARQAFRSTDRDPLTALGWWDLLADLDDVEGRAAAFAVFRAQGRELHGSVALGAVLAQPFLAAAGVEAGGAVAALGTGRLVVVGDAAGRPVLVDRPGEGIAVVPAHRVRLRPVPIPGRLALHEVEVPDVAPTISEAAAAKARDRSLVLGRLALAAEILGAAEGTLALAVAHAGTREQFGQPIGAFQAVRHLLARAKVDLVALENVVTAAVDGTTPTGYGEVVKALAGRNGRRVCQATLQVLGAIGFTAEHDHHHFHGRVLALDALLGSSTELTHALGARFRETGDTPTLLATDLLVGR